VSLIPAGQRPIECLADRVIGGCELDGSTVHNPHRGVTWYYCEACP
jgi:hypothetical protein